MRVPRLSTLALAGALALTSCQKKDTTPSKLTDSMEGTREAVATELAEEDPSECKVEKTGFEWKLTQGKCDENGLAQGQGKALSSDGGVYEGGFKDGKFDGHGIYTWLDGTKYVGEWKDGEENGHGAYAWPAGQYDGEAQDAGQYVGGHKDGLEHGHGALTWSDGTKYVGEFRDGTYNGYGILYYLGTITAGEWANGEEVKGKVKKYKTPNAMYVLATGLEAEGKVEEAKGVYQYITKIAPDSDAAVKAAERLLVLSGKNEDAPKTGE